MSKPIRTQTLTAAMDGQHLRQALQPLLRRNADERQRIVEKAVDRLVDPLPDERGRDQRRGEGQEVHRRPDVAPLEIADPVEAECHGERKDDRRGHGEQQQLDRVPDGGPERGVGEDLFIKAQADELLRSARGDLVERIQDRLRERQDENRAEEQQRGEDEQEPCPLAAIEVVPGERDAKPLAHGSGDRLITRTAARRRASPAVAPLPQVISQRTG